MKDDDNSINLEKKVAVVTGGGRGIGRAAAIQLAKAGAAVVVTARTAAEIQETADQIQQEGGQALARAADVADWPSMQKLAQETTEAFGPADIVVANASIINPVGDTWEVDPDEWAKNLTVNLIGAFNATRAFLPAMTKRDKGVLVFVSSGAATHPVPGWSAYCAAKAGLDHFARNVASELEQRGLSIRVHFFYPGVVATAMQEKIRQSSKEQFPLVDKFQDYQEQGVLRPPEEPGTVIRWLATPLAADLHGQAASIDDAKIRERVAADLGIPPFKGRGE